MIKPQSRAENPVTAIEMKKSLVGAKSNPTIVDVGACTGQTVNDYLASFPTANIFAFEPTPASFTQLQKRFGGNEQVKCFNLAVSDVNGVIPFHLNEFSPTNSSLPTDPKAGIHWGDELLSTTDTVSIQSRRLEGICETNDIGHIDILKLDVQGLELQVLRGSEKLLNSNRISVIYLEVIFVPTYKGQSSYIEISQFLSSKGYNLYGMFILTYDKRLKQADILFYRE
jgi:FkbM family methyltransferase